MSKKEPKRESEPGWVYESLRVTGLVVLTLVVGMSMADAKMWPYEPHLRNALHALRTGVSQILRPGVAETGGIWHPVRTRETGVSKHAPNDAFAGYTLYTSGHAPAAFLIDMNGELVHQWRAEFSDVFDVERDSNAVFGEHIYWPRAHVFPNGDLLAIYAGYGGTPWGLGLAKFDRSGDVLWTYDARAHHSFDVGDDGSIVVLTHAMRDTTERPVYGDPALHSDDVLEDFVVRLSPDGEELGRTSLLDVVAKSPYRGTLGQMSLPQYETWDPLHANDVEIVGSAFASHYEFVEPNDVIVSLRTTDMVAIVDLEAEAIRWASRGFWAHQHDPDPLADGWIMLFDNIGRPGPGGLSRVVSFHPVTGAVRWTFEGSKDHFFESVTRSNQQLLGNGNVLIVESDAGRILEVTSAGKIVWEFHNPERRDDGDYLPSILDAARHPRTYFDVGFGSGSDGG